ncbi:hypothetical protein [Salinibius halmophilus]|uniref:hypothetical protein n=1 Tax=Salinibius halmophilus TaxID=1853216 RepID=UPI000E660E37|nr:hypothetical protein [Salinibius halmophilus]
MGKYFVALMACAVLIGCSLEEQSVEASQHLQQRLSQFSQIVATSNELMQSAQSLPSAPQTIEQVTLTLADLHRRIAAIDPLLVLPDDSEQRWQRIYFPGANRQYLLPSPDYPFAGIIADRTIALVADSLIDEHQVVMASDQALGIDALMIVASSITPNDTLLERKHRYLAEATEQLHRDLAYINGRWQQLTIEGASQSLLEQWQAAYNSAAAARSLPSSTLQSMLINK